MKNSLRKFFSFSALERKGILILIILIIMLTIVQAYLKFHSPGTSELNHQLLALGELGSFEEGLTEKADCTWVENHPEFTGELFPFDPNTVTAADMKRMGMTNSLIRTLQRYRTSGGRFYRKEDLLKIYGMDEIFYKRISPFIEITRQDEKVKTLRYSKNTFSPEIININLADSAMIESLPGIGPAFARRIVNYRKLLGGFYQKEQLSEVYGIADSVLIKIDKHILIDTSYIQKINVNEASETDLSRHPYIGRHIAQGIIRYRKEVKKIENLKELIHNGLISNDQYLRIEKYLTI